MQEKDTIFMIKILLCNVRQPRLVRFLKLDLRYNSWIEVTH